MNKESSYNTESSVLLLSLSTPVTSALTLGGAPRCGPATKPSLIMKILSSHLYKVKMFKGFKHFSWKVKQNKALRENKISDMRLQTQVLGASL